MAVSVRASYSMPHLHTMDFDLSPKGRFDQGERWGNSSPVLILSLLEIVEKENDVHVREAALRLKPGWVRNACAAFEQGMAFSNFDSLHIRKNQESVPRKSTQNVKQNSQSKPTPKTSTTRREERTRRSTLSKSRSLDGLNDHQRSVSKDVKVSLLEEAKNDSSTSSSSKLDSNRLQENSHRVLKEQNVPKLKRSKSTSNKSLACTTTKRKVPTPNRRHAKETISTEAAARAVLQSTRCYSNGENVSDKHQQCKRPSSRKLTTHMSASDVDGVPIIEHKLSNAVVSKGMENNASSKSLNISRIPQAHLQETVQAADVLRGDPMCAADYNGHAAYVSIESTHVPIRENIFPMSTSKDDIVKTCTEMNKSVDALCIPHDQQAGAVTKTEGQQSGNTCHPNTTTDIHGNTDHHNTTIGTHGNTCHSITTTDSHRDHDDKLVGGSSSPGCSKELLSNMSEDEDSICGHTDGTPSTGPTESLSLVKDAAAAAAPLNRMDSAISNAATRYLVVCQGVVSVSLKSSVCVTRKQNSVGGVSRDGAEATSAMLKSAMCQSATGVASQGIPSSSHKAAEVVVGSFMESASEMEDKVTTSSSLGSDLEEISVRLQDKWKHPQDVLDAQLLSKNANIFDSIVEWKAHFISSRHLSISRPRFTANYRLQVCEEKGTEVETSADHLVNLRKAFEKKWSRPNISLIAKRGSKNFDSFHYQVKNHPLAYHDPYQTDESDSENEDEFNSDIVTDFARIPTYIIAQIFRYLKTRDLAALKGTCMDFHWLIIHFNIVPTDTKWVSTDSYRNDPCMYCGKIRDPKGDVSLCTRHTKTYYRSSHIGRCYWTCCNAIDKGADGCRVELHNNKWATTNFAPSFICKPWRSMSWHVTANYERWCDKEHL